MEQTTIIVIIILAFSVVQSVFGMGLLVFGTPTLLLLGLPFPVALGWLLPASLAISTIQVAGGYSYARSTWVHARPLLCLLPLVAVLALVLTFNLHAKIDVAIGVTMLLASAIRINIKLQQRLAQFIARAENPYLLVMGAVHGLTNMGGALLSVYASTVYREKTEIRATIATYYLSFGIVQIATIAVLKPEVLGLHSVIAAIVAALVYGMVGQLIFQRASGVFYDKAITGFIAVYGAAVLIKSSF